MYRIKRAKVDSLYDAGDYAQVIFELDPFLMRVDNIGEHAYWNATQLYIRLGSAYRLSGHTDKAIRVWHRGIETDDTEQMYGDYYMGQIAESLHVYDSTFTDDSLAVFNMESSPFYTEDLITSTMRIFIGILCNAAVWFIIGAVILLGAVIASAQHAGASDVSAAVRIQWGKIAVRFLLYIAVPSIAVPLVMSLAIKKPSLYMMSLFIANIGGAAIGLLLAVLDAVRQAKKENLPVREILLRSFLALWLCLAVVTTIGMSLVILFAGFAFLMTFM